MRFKPNQTGFKYNNDGSVQTTSVQTTSVQTTKEVNSAEIIIQCKDYGAYGQIKAETISIETKDEKLVAQIKEGDGDIHDYTTIPIDEDDDKMADLWEKPYRNMNDIVGDLSPYFDGDYAYNNPKVDKHNPLVGDGIRAIDEYRGFMIDGNFVRTDPTVKDIFVYIGKGMYGYLIPKIGSIDIKPNEVNMQNLGYNLHFIKDNECQIEDRLLNFNSVLVPSQRAIWLRNRKLPDGYYGVNMTNSGQIGIGTPWDYGNIIIDIEFIAKTLKRYRPDVDSDLYKNTFENFCDHEIGHALFLNHHTGWGHLHCLMHTGYIGNQQIDFESYIGARKDGFCEDYSHGEIPCRLKTRIK